MSGWSPCSQGLEDVEAKALPRPQGRDPEAPGKVTGFDTCQSVKRWDRSKYPRELSGKGAGPMTSGNHPLPAPPSFPLPTWESWGESL